MLHLNAVQSHSPPPPASAYTWISVRELKREQTDG